jgi:hypothetical protein
MAIDIQQSIFSELAEFLVSQPTLQDIANYKIPPAIQQHLDALLEKNRESGLSPDERLEVEKILAILDLMDLAKAKARLKLADQS